MDHFSILLDAPATATSQVQIAKLGDYSDGRYGDFKITADDVAQWRENLARLPGGRALIDEDHKADQPQPHRDTEADGWITGIELEDGEPVATCEWTPKGQKALEEKRYLFVSPVFGDYTDDSGTVYPQTLMGVSLTNKPFLNMPTVQLASEDRLTSMMLDEEPARLVHRLLLEGFTDTASLKVLAGVSAATRKEYAAKGWALADGSYPIGNTVELKAAAILCASKHGNYKAAEALIKRRAKDLGVDVTTLPGFAPAKKLEMPPAQKPAVSDNRGSMELTADTLKALGIEDEAAQKVILELAAAEDADTLKVLEAIDAAKPTPKPEPVAPVEPVKTLEQQAAESGKVLLDQAAVVKLTADAQAGREAKIELDANRFETAFEKAIDAGKAAPAQKPEYEELYELDKDRALKMLDNAPQIVGTTPKGHGVTEDELETPAGVDPQSHKLDQEVRKYILENKLDANRDYPKALEAVTGMSLGQGGA